MQNIKCVWYVNTGLRRVIGCLIFTCRFPKKSPIVSDSSAENDMKLMQKYEVCIQIMYMRYVQQWKDNDLYVVCTRYSVFPAIKLWYSAFSAFNSWCSAFAAFKSWCSAFKSWYSAFSACKSWYSAFAAFEKTTARPYESCTNI